MKQTHPDLLEWNHVRSNKGSHDVIKKPDQTMRTSPFSDSSRDADLLCGGRSGKFSPSVLPPVQPQEVYNPQGRGLFFLSAKQRTTRPLCIRASYHPCVFSLHPSLLRLEVTELQQQPCWTPDDDVPQQQISSLVFRPKRV